MKIGYLECFAGIAGDMFLGAMVHAGVPLELLDDAAERLNLGASLRVTTVDRSGISALKVDVLDHGELAEERPFSHSHLEVAPPEQSEGREFQQTPQPKTQHEHKAGHDSAHEPEVAASYEHLHGRSLTEIRRLIEASSLAVEVKGHAIRTFELLGASEAKIHNVAIDTIHFHEVGAVDAIVDIVAAAAGVHHLQLDRWYSSPVNVGGGMVACAHGSFPVPAPATADLLRGFPTYSAHLMKELVTPTGAALLRSLSPQFGPQPAMRVSAIGYGAGTRNPANFPNVLRLTLGESDAALETDIVAVLETALDDLSPQVIAYAAEKALAEGALDVMLTPVVMKKGRPGTLLTLLCRPEQSAFFAQRLMAETTTLGVRIREERRLILAREHVAVTTAFGTIRMKVARHEGGLRNAAPEFEDCKAAAAAHNVPLKQVQAAAIAAFAETDIA